MVLQATNAVEVAYVELSGATRFGAVEKFSLSDQPPLTFPGESLGSLVSKALQLRPEVVALRDEVKGAQKEAAAAMDARFPKIEALGSAGRTTVGDSAVQGNYAVVGIDVEFPVFTGGLLSARQKEETLRGKRRTETCGECAASLGVGRRAVHRWPDVDDRTESGAIKCPASRNRCVFCQLPSTIIRSIVCN